MALDLRRQLTENAELRARLGDELRAAEQDEHQLIAAAWRAHMPPQEIAELTGRSAAHIRKLRPEDVPPLRKGGGAAPKRRRRK